MTKQILISAALLLVLLSSGPFRASFGEGNTDLEKPTEAEHPAVTAIDTQIIEFDQLLTDYESLEHDTTSVVNGLNNLGLYYSKLMMSLARTKSLIARVSQQNRKLRDEGNGLKEENDKLPNAGKLVVIGRHNRRLSSEPSFGARRFSGCRGA